MKVVVKGSYVDDDSSNSCRLQIDEVRINQIYEQAKYQILSEEVDCTEEESITFGALMFQVKVGGNKPQSNDETDGDDIDAALNELAVSICLISSPKMFEHSLHFLRLRPL